MFGINQWSDTGPSWPSCYLFTPCAPISFRVTVHVNPGDSYIPRLDCSIIFRSLFGFRNGTISHHGLYRSVLRHSGSFYTCPVDFGISTHSHEHGTCPQIDVKQNRLMSTKIALKKAAHDVFSRRRGSFTQVNDFFFFFIIQRIVS